jgi:sporulation-control protein
MVRMSFFKKAAASIGIGSAKVDTVLHSTSYSQGDEVTGVVHVTGGNVEQSMSDIDIEVMTKYLIEEDDKKHYREVKLLSHRVTNSFIIKAGEQKDFYFSFHLPLDTPVSVRNVSVWIHTDVDIEKGVDSKDNDSIKVVPHKWINNVLQAVEQIGFRLHKADCEHAPYFRRRLPFVQEFEFRPVSSQYRGKLDELELVFQLEDHGLEVIVEVDRKARGMFGWLEEMYNDGERLLRVYFDKTELESGQKHVETKLQSLINQYAG